VSFGFSGARGAIFQRRDRRALQFFERHVRERRDGRFVRCLPAHVIERTIADPNLFSANAAAPAEGTHKTKREILDWGDVFQLCEGIQKTRNNNGLRQLCVSLFFEANRTPQQFDRRQIRRPSNLMRVELEL